MGFHSRPSHQRRPSGDSTDRGEAGPREPRFIVSRTTVTTTAAPTTNRKKITR